MGNASTSEVINDILEKLDSLGVFTNLGAEKTEEFIRFIDEIGKREDCIRIYMYEGVGKRLGICCGCAKKFDLLNEEGFCKTCWYEIEHQ